MDKLIVGLGNPTAAYAESRHNIGFMVVAELARTFNISLKKRNFRFKATLGVGNLGRRPVTLSQPLTYMNLSGKAVSKLCRYFKIKPEDVLIIHDDMDISFGRIKIKLKGGDGGHKGVGSVIKELGTGDFLRIRVGVGRPPSNENVVDYVLQSFSAQERLKLPEVLDIAVQAVETIINSGYELAMNRFN